ncbi:unnamed protein product [Adineta steineri]|uniref:Uncharacterized protein n=1 Tax=Adineta steineri TaxID=433720 RepID=A0A813MZW2_9BILA|nr:unnamed protein product [Adineta steineri]CAF0847587.1 unnamed protein product [Adineta steineri]CAF1153719.1 unnamed protein product [Adineta steineri]
MKSPEYHGTGRFRAGLFDLGMLHKHHGEPVRIAFFNTVSVQKAFLDILHLNSIKLKNTDQSVKGIFKTFFQTLVDNDLLKITNNIEQTKAQAMIGVYPLIEELFNNNIDLHKFLKKVLGLLNIDENVKFNLNTIFERIIMGIELIKDHEQGISGVPHFRINDKIELSGAQDPQQFIQAFRKAGVNV